MFCLYYVFQMEELIDVHHALYGRLGVIQCLSFWNGIGQVSSDMRPAGCAFRIRHFVIPAVSVTHQVSFKTAEEIHSIFPGSGF